MNFENYIEEWASKYKPILHIAGERSRNKRFFLVDSIVNVPQLAANLNSSKSPCVAFEFPQEGNIEGNVSETEYTFGILVKAGDTNFVEKSRANEAVQEAIAHGKKLIAWLRMKQETDRALAPLDLDRVKYSTLSAVYNNWYEVFFTIDATICSKETYIPEDYIE